MTGLRELLNSRRFRDLRDGLLAGGLAGEAAVGDGGWLRLACLAMSLVIIALWVTEALLAKQLLALQFAEAMRTHRAIVIDPEHIERITWGDPA